MSAGDSQSGDSRPKVESMLVMSGGEGYIDFRIGEYLVPSSHTRQGQTACWEKDRHVTSSIFVLFLFYL